MDEAIIGCQSKMETSVVGYTNLEPMYLEVCAFADDIMFANSGTICRKPTNLDESFRSTEITSTSKNPGKKEDNGFGFINIEHIQYLGSTVDNMGKQTTNWTNNEYKQQMEYIAHCRGGFDYEEVTRKQKYQFINLCI